MDIIVKIEVEIEVKIEVKAEILLGRRDVLDKESGKLGIWDVYCGCVLWM